MYKLISAVALLLCCACSDDVDKNPGGGLDSRQCTLIGCGGNLAVTVKGSSGAVVKRHHGSVTLEGTSGTFACTGSGGTSKGPCTCDLEGSLRCLSLKGGDLEIEVISDETKEKYKGVLKPAYTFSYPNGKNCPPKCYKADEAVTLAAY